MNRLKRCGGTQVGWHLEQWPGWCCFGQATTISHPVLDGRAVQPLATVPLQPVADEVGRVADGGTDEGVEGGVVALGQVCRPDLGLCQSHWGLVRWPVLVVVAAKPESRLLVSSLANGETYERTSSSVRAA